MRLVGRFIAEAVLWAALFSSSTIHLLVQTLHSSQVEHQTVGFAANLSSICLGPSSRWMRTGLLITVCSRCYVGIDVNMSVSLQYTTRTLPWLLVEEEGYQEENDENGRRIGKRQ